MEHKDEKMYTENETAPVEKEKANKIRRIFSRQNLSQLPVCFRKWFKENLTRETLTRNVKVHRKGLIRTGVALVIIIGGIVGIRYATNNYMSPIHSYEKTQNNETINYKKQMRSGLRNLGAKNARKLIKILGESDEILDYVDYVEQDHELSYEQCLDNYGDDFEITYTVEEKVELEKADLRDWQQTFRSAVKSIDYIVAATEDFDSSDWADFSDDLGLTRARTKDLIDALSEAIEDIGRVEVTKGYELHILKRTTGNMLDEPLEETEIIEVVKVNGHWVYAADIDELVETLYFML